MADAKATQHCGEWQTIELHLILVSNWMTDDRCCEICLWICNLTRKRAFQSLLNSLFCCNHWMFAPRLSVVTPQYGYFSLVSVQRCKVGYFDQHRSAFITTRPVIEAAWKAIYIQLLKSSRFVSEVNECNFLKLNFVDLTEIHEQTAYVHQRINTQK